MMLKISTRSNQAEESVIRASAAEYAPIRIIEIEIGQALPTISAVDAKTGQRYQRAMCLVRLHTQPLGVVELQLDKDEVNADEYAADIWHALKSKINEHLQQDALLPVIMLDAAGLPSSSTPTCLKERERFLAQAPFVSIIVPTHDRPESLQACLHSLLALHYPQYEVIIVDNAPSTNVTANLIRRVHKDTSKVQVRYLRESRVGVSWARNCGILAAKGEILAFADDDVVVDPYWLVESVRGFSLADNVACVTGLVLPLELETAAQFWFEEYGGFTQGFTERIFNMRDHHPKTPLYPYTAGSCGVGANMVFTASFLHRVGGFDPALGGSGPSRNSQDVAAFFQVITQGFTLVYTPTSLLYHLHRRDYTSLRKQIYGYGIGFTAYLMKSLFDNPHLLLDFASKVPFGVFRILNARSSKNSKKSTTYPKELNILELKGMLYGPLAYLQSRWAIHHARKAMIKEIQKIENIALSVD